MSFPRSVWLVPLVLSLSACSGGESTLAPDERSVRTLVEGEVVGFAHPDHEAHVWRGVPFAKPPVEELRWRAPLPPEPWEGRRSMLEVATECVQLDMRDPTIVVGEEDCLTLDVYAPRFDADAVPKGAAQLPVMMWIHGGGNSIGSAEVYDAARLAAEDDVIVFAIHYRLGVLGWLSHPALRDTAANPADASGNFGTLDTIRALEWIRDNAARFGGDPGNVTVFGESAGGINTFALLLSPRAKGLFHRAISQSGILVSTTRAEAENFVDAEEPGLPGSASEFLAGHLVSDGRAADREAAKGVLAGMEPAEVEAYLRGKSGAELLSVFEANLMGGMYFSPNVIRDGHVIVDRPALEALASPESHNAVPTIVGTNREETKLFAAFSSPHVRRWFGVPVGFRDADAFDRAGEYGGLLWKAQGADQPAEAMVRGGRRDVFGYRFDWDEQGDLGWLDLGRLLGSSHAVELLFVFGFTDLGRWTDNMYADLDTAERLSHQMRSYWTQFARTGDPGRGRAGDQARWAPWGPKAGVPKYLLLDTDAAGGLRMASEIVAVDDVVGRLEEDQRLVEMAERCTILRDLAQFSPNVTEDDYVAFASGACADDPLPDFPPLGG